MATLLNIAGVLVVLALGPALALMTLADSVTNFLDMVNMLIDIVRDII